MLLTRPTRGLFFSRGCFGRIDTLGSHFVGLLLRGGATLGASLCCGVLAVLGRVPRCRDFPLFRCARVAQALFRLIALGFQFIGRLLLLPGRRRVELSDTAQRIAALGERGATLLQFRSPKTMPAAVSSAPSQRS